MAVSAQKARNPLLQFFLSLHQIKFGKTKSEHAHDKIPRRDLAAILNHLATLVENGLSLPHALGTLADERSLKKYRPMISDLKKQVERGESFSQAMAEYPGIFNELMVNQIQIGERSGTVAQTLMRISDQLEEQGKLKALLIKRLSYPLVVLGAGLFVILFMMLFILPVFEETYAKANIPLPFATRLLIGVGHFLMHYGLFVLAFLAVAFAVWRWVKNHPVWSHALDQYLLKIPVAGEVLRDIAILQFVEALNIMLESGFKLVDALKHSTGTIGNRAIRRSAEGLERAVLQGERLSQEMDKHREIFPAVMSQLVIVGEQTGKLPKSTRHIREHLHQGILRKVNLFVGMLEPVLTIGMAITVGAILLAIYLPMFDMAQVVDSSVKTP